MTFPNFLKQLAFSKGKGLIKEKTEGVDTSLTTLHAQTTVSIYCKTKITSKKKPTTIRYQNTCHH